VDIHTSTFIYGLDITRRIDGYNFFCMHGTPYFIFNYYSNNTMKVDRETISNFCNSLLNDYPSTSAIFMRPSRRIGNNREFDIEIYYNNRQNLTVKAFDESTLTIVDFPPSIDTDSNFTKVHWGEPIITEDCLV